MLAGKWPAHSFKPRRGNLSHMARNSIGVVTAVVQDLIRPLHTSKAEGPFGIQTIVEHERHIGQGRGHPDGLLRAGKAREQLLARNVVTALGLAKRDTHD